MFVCLTFLQVELQENEQFANEISVEIAGAKRVLAKRGRPPDDSL